VRELAPPKLQKKGKTMTKHNLNHKEMTSHIRKRIKIAGVKANVRMQKGLGNDKIIQVNTIEYGVEFTKEEQRAIRHIAVCNNLTWVRNMPIDVEQMTNPYDFNFYM
tara:strand:+ start:72 stop:392 length:321 start_codon:yes stop_codon:yes gene_type:complete